VDVFRKQRRQEKFHGVDYSGCFMGKQ
jgi:hypothetical protein